jgi:sugar/nucleoside kinase (ribokinase family)
MVLNLQKKGCKTVIITLGKLGAVYNDGEKIIHVPLPKQIQQINAIDSTGSPFPF